MYVYYLFVSSYEHLPSPITFSACSRVCICVFPMRTGNSKLTRDLWENVHPSLVPEAEANARQWGGKARQWGGTTLLFLYYQILLDFL